MKKRRSPSSTRRLELLVLPNAEDLLRRRTFPHRLRCSSSYPIEICCLPTPACLQREDVLYSGQAHLR